MDELGESIIENSGLGRILKEKEEDIETLFVSFESKRLKIDPFKIKCKLSKLYFPKGEQLWISKANP